MTSGWHSATVSATAFEPSSCLGMDCLRGQTAMSGPGGGRVALGHPPGEPLADRAFDGVDGYGTGGGGHSAEKGGVGQEPAEMLAGQVGGRHGDDAGAFGERAEAE